MKTMKIETSTTNPDYLRSYKNISFCPEIYNKIHSRQEKIKVIGGAHIINYFKQTKTKLACTSYSFTPY